MIRGETLRLWNIWQMLIIVIAIKGLILTNHLSLQLDFRVWLEKNYRNLMIKYVWEEWLLYDYCFQNFFCFQVYGLNTDTYLFIVSSKWLRNFIKGNDLKEIPNHVSTLLLIAEQFTTLFRKSTRVQLNLKYFKYSFKIYFLK